jgi:hypothetical protein
LFVRFFLALLLRVGLGLEGTRHGHFVAHML